MTAAFESIKQGLQEAIAHARGEAPQVRVHYPRAVDVKAVRAKVKRGAKTQAPRVR